VGSSSISPQYDDDGNMTEYGSWTYTWDAENRIVKAVNGTTRLEFIYDALSRRVAKKLYQGNTLSKHERYVYDGMKLLASYNAKSSFAKINTFLWQPFGADVPLIMTYGSTIYGYLVDANKNVLGLFNPSQSRVATYLYGPFGQIISSSGTIAANNPIRFSSEHFDADLGLVYYNYRYYSPELGRWLSKDPIGEEGGLNLYLMCGNNVVNVWDVLGEEAILLVVGLLITASLLCSCEKKNEIDAALDTCDEITDNLNKLTDTLDFVDIVTEKDPVDQKLKLSEKITSGIWPSSINPARILREIIFRELGKPNEKKKDKEDF
jgi:RHS repeat-associated protein